MARLSGSLVALLSLLVGCAAAPPASPASTPEEDRRAVEALKREFTSERARIASRCETGDPETKRHVKAEVWGKDDGPPGLPAVRVEAFLCRQRRELEAACWHPKFADWERSEIEYGFVVDPSGAVLNNGHHDDDAATAALERGNTRVESSELAHCVENVVATWTFPRATMPTWMRLTFRVPD